MKRNEDISQDTTLHRILHFLKRLCGLAVILTLFQEWTDETLAGMAQTSQTAGMTPQRNKTN